MSQKIRQEVFIDGSRYMPEIILIKDGLYFLIWKATKIIGTRHIEMLGVFPDKQSCKNLFPHASIKDCTDSTVSNDLKRLVNIILQYHSFKQYPTIPFTPKTFMKSYPISDEISHDEKHFGKNNKYSPGFGD